DEQFESPSKPKFPILLPHRLRVTTEASCRPVKYTTQMIADGVEDEEKWLAAGIAGLQQNAFYMHRALDTNNLRDALKFSAQMLSELRTSKLSPHKYYELYMRAFDELRKLEIFFKEETRRGCSIVELYELVQHAGNILPRLYLLCTVGSVYIRSKEAPAKDVLKDLVEMCRGIQHPVRGLFLRSYLSQISRDKLPDIGSEYEGDADTVVDAVEFVLQNFTEMNKLWVRMQHQGPAREKQRREKERNELRDLVGKNLHVLSQVEGIDLDMYRDTVLPRVLEQIVNCKDEIAQFYLMDCIIQVFPDEYHLQTLEVLLGACPQLQPSVDIKTVLSRLMERLSNYAASSSEVLPEFLQVEAFSRLNNAIGKSSLLTFTLHVHPDRLDYADQVLGSCFKKLQSVGKVEDNKATKQIVALLSAPLEKYNDIVTALKLSNYPCVMEYLDTETSKIMATVIIQSIMKNSTRISSADKVQVEALFELMKGLMKDSEGTAEEVDEDDFKEEQNSVARLIQMLINDDPEEMFKVLFSTTPKTIFQLLNQVLLTIPAPELALRLYLQCAEAANDTDLEPVAYDFFTQAYILYENRDTLTHKATGPDQCRAVYGCAHLFWVDDQDNLKDGERRALRIANAAQQLSNAARGSTGPVTLFIEILNKYLYFYEKVNQHITVDAVNSLIELITTEMQQNDSSSSAPDPAAEAFLAGTLRYIQFQKQKGGTIGERYQAISTVKE
ncbi:unnamed protein product, partial [Linum tenue]